MEIDWGRYHLGQEPFPQYPGVNPSSPDDRINGRIFSKVGYEKQYDGLIGLIQREKGICYVRANTDVLGTGKSALMAAVYWSLKAENRNPAMYFPVWLEVETFSNISQLLGRVLDSLVSENLIDEIRKKLPDPSPSAIDSYLKERIRQRSPSAILALSRILQVPKEELPTKYTNIRRSISTVSAVEIFQYILNAFGRAKKGRVIVFIDQFEEYVRYQRTMRGSAGIRRLGDDMNDLIRAVQNCGNISFVLSLHPTSEDLLLAVGPLIETFGTIEENSVTVGKLNTEAFVAMAREYLAHFRPKNVPPDLDPLAPFAQDVVSYLAGEAKGVPRNFIRFLHNALEETALKDLDQVTLDFVQSPEVLARIGTKVK